LDPQAFDEDQKPSFGGRYKKLFARRKQMRTVLRKIGIAAAAAIIIVGSTAMLPSVAHAQHHRHGGHGWGGFAAGAAAGAILGGILAAPYYAQGPYYYPAPGYYGGYEGDAVRYCMQRFRSYDPGSGTYLGYDGYRHPCP
jgi:hypothetical protein